MAYGFNLEEVMSGDLPVYVMNWRSKYAHIYEKIEEYIKNNNTDWIKISGLENHSYAASVRNGIRRQFPGKNFDIKIRKYDGNGNINFTVFARYLFG